MTRISRLTVSWTLLATVAAVCVGSVPAASARDWIPLRLKRTTISGNGPDRSGWSLVLPEEFTRDALSDDVVDTCHDALRDEGWSACTVRLGLCASMILKETSTTVVLDTDWCAKEFRRNAQGALYLVKSGAGRSPEAVRFPPMAKESSDDVQDNE